MVKCKCADHNYVAALTGCFRKSIFENDLSRKQSKISNLNFKYEINECQKGILAGFRKTYSHEHAITFRYAIMYRIILKSGSAFQRLKRAFANWLDLINRLYVSFQGNHAHLLHIEHQKYHYNFLET